AKLRGKNVQEKQEHFDPVPAPAPTPVQQQPAKQKTRNQNNNNQNDERMMSKVKRVFRYLWD
ncbi:cell division protein FtsA C-terminal domain-containing protein, partial [Bacillus sp. 'calajunan']|uniref:cell division protein FtsA C-terminal domain-containing protein n=1 Tax=Bacillus sp. 'calajunan' TaxID=3447457 RepID=UPI003EE1B1C4